MVFSVRKHVEDNYNIDIEDDIDHELIGEMEDDYEVRKYLDVLGKTAYEDRTYAPTTWSVRYDILLDGEKVREYYRDYTDSLPTGD